MQVDSYSVRICVGSGVDRADGSSNLHKETGQGKPYPVSDLIFQLNRHLAKFEVLGHLLSFILMYSRSMNFTCLVKSR